MSHPAEDFPCQNCHTTHGPYERCPAAPVLFGDFAGRYLETKLLNPSLAENTKRLFRGQLEGTTKQGRPRLIPAMGHLPIDQINNGPWLRWVNETIKNYGQIKFFNARKVLLEILHAAQTSLMPASIFFVSNLLSIC
jgi:hypothetical protein